LASKIIVAGHEDTYSKAEEEPGKAYKGRMCPPKADMTTIAPDGTITGVTRGHTVQASPNGGITITTTKDGNVVFTKEGGG